ncbi:MAG: alpha/beta family hydrolase [Acidobacteriota bacterium]|nr:alpha/beta family hydrolase [Acidobacteriota bacterium]
MRLKSDDCTASPTRRDSGTTRDTLATPVSTELRFQATNSSGEVSALLDLPSEATAVYVLGHGAGAGMRHPFMATMAQRLSERGIGTFRYQFPYLEQGKKRPGPAVVDQKTVRSAVAAVGEHTSLPILAGGKSYGGRMTGYAAADGGLEGVVGLVFLGFPLHAPGRDNTDRWEPMTRVEMPMLFLQGTRDSLAKLDLLEPVVEALRPAATLHVVDGGDHSFRTPKRLGRSQDQIFDELADAIAQWIVERLLEA